MGTRVVGGNTSQQATVDESSVQTEKPMDWGIGGDRKRDERPIS